MSTPAQGADRRRLRGGRRRPWNSRRNGWWFWRCSIMASACAAQSGLSRRRYRGERAVSRDEFHSLAVRTASHPNPPGSALPWSPKAKRNPPRRSGEGRKGKFQAW